MILLILLPHPSIHVGSGWLTAIIRIDQSRTVLCPTQESLLLTIFKKSLHLLRYQSYDLQGVLTLEILGGRGLSG